MAITILLYKGDDGRIPLVDWLDTLPEKVLLKCLNRLERLREAGHSLRRPEADYLCEGIYELRTRHLKVNYRMLYFFHGRETAVISHGLVKESAIPARELERAVEYMRCFKADPETHQAQEDYGK